MTGCPTTTPTRAPTSMNGPSGKARRLVTTDSPAPKGRPRAGDPAQDQGGPRPPHQLGQGQPAQGKPQQPGESDVAVPEAARVDEQEQEERPVVDEPPEGGPLQAAEVAAAG